MPTSKVTVDPSRLNLDSLFQKVGLPTDSPLDPQKLSDEAAANTPAKAPEPKGLLFEDAPPAIETPVEKDEPKSSEDTVPSDVGEPVSEDPQERNFKALRQREKEARDLVKTITEELTTTKKKLEEYETGAIVPTVLEEKEKRIQELEKWEQIYNLKGSKVYQDKIATPLNALTSKLDAIANDYGIPSEVLKRAVNYTGRELNQFLSSHMDDLGASDVRSIVKEMRELNNYAQEVEKSPGEALARLEEEHKAVQAQKDAERRNSIANSSKDAWLESLHSIRKEGKALGLIEKENDTEHNERIRPILSQASTEYGKLVVMLAENGLSKLPKDLAYAMARMTQLAHESAIARLTAQQLAEQVQELEENSGRANRLFRPPVGAMHGRDKGDAPQVPKQEGAGAAADRILNQVLQGSR